MIRRTKRSFSEGDRRALLDAMEQCRKACVQTRTVAPIGGDVYQGAGELMRAVDEMAEVLTGDRTHFHGKSHSAG